MSDSPGNPNAVGRLPPAGISTEEPPPRRLRRLHRVWPDRDGNISYLLTLCVDGRAPVLNNEEILQRLAAFLLDSPARYDWFGRRFVLMPDHLHLIAHMGHNAVRLGQWIKALKAVVGGLKPRESPGAASGDAAYKAKPVTHVGRVPPHGVPTPPPNDEGRVPPHGVPTPPPNDEGRVPPHGVPTPPPNDEGRVPPHGVPTPPPNDEGRVPPHGVPTPPPNDEGRLPSTGALPHEFARIQRSWRWQDGFHDHKFRSPESETRKWEYVCLNPVRYGLVKRPEEWPFGGEIFYGEASGPKLVRGTPPLLETGILAEEGTPREGTRPST